MTTTASPATSSSQLRIETRCPSPGTAQIAVIGEIDLATTDALQADLLGILSELRPHHIDIDLAGVTFMDCCGLTVLVVVNQAAARTGCHLQITNPRPIVRRILEIAGLLAILAPHSTGVPSHRPRPALRA